MQSTRKIALLMGFLALAAMMAGCSTTSPTTPQPAATQPADWQFHDIVDVAYVQQYVKAPMTADVMIIDARPKRAKYDKGHIPMAVSIPDSQFDKLKDQLPENKNTQLIFYCGGLTCKLSHKSARKAEALGYTNVKVFAEGFPAWMKVDGNYAAVSADWMKKQIDSKAAMVVVDSRPKRTKYDKGHIPTAISIPDSQFDKFKDQLPADKATPLVFYCGGLKCPLSHKSAKKALAMGYTNVKVFATGYPAWKAVAGTATMAQAGTSALKAGKEEGSIDHDMFKKIVAENPQSIHLIDVRDKDEFAAGSLKAAVNIPVDELEATVKTLPTDKPLVFFCSTGARSGESYYMIKDLRPELKDVYYVDGELEFNKDGSYSLKKAI